MVTYSPNSFFERGRGSIYKSPPKSKPKNANQQAAESMGSVGIGGISGNTTTSSAQKIQDRFKEQTQKDNGNTKGLGAKPNITMEEVDTPNALTKKERIYEALMVASAAVGLTSPQPTKAYTYDPIKVYTSEMINPQGTVGGNQQPLYTPDTRGFGQSVDNRALFERLDNPFRLGQGTDTTPNMGGEITNPNMDMVSPTIPNPVIPESPSGVGRVSRAISQAMLPTEVEYTIQDGDTLSEIAREAGTTVEELKELNNIEDIDIIDAGSNLKVPVKSGKLTDTQAALRRGLGSKKDNKGIKVAGGTMEELGKLLRAYTDQMEGNVTTDPDPDAQFYNSFRQDVTESSENKDLTNKFYDNIGTYGEGDHGNTPVQSNDVGASADNLDVGYGHKLKQSEKNSGMIHGIKFKKEDGTYIPLTEVQKREILKKDFKVETNLARTVQNGWDSKLEKKGSSWDQLDSKYKNALSSLAFNTGGALAGKGWTKVLDAAIAEDPKAFATEMRRTRDVRQPDGTIKKVKDEAMDNRVAKELYYAGIIDNLSEVSDELPEATAGSGVPQ